MWIPVGGINLFSNASSAQAIIPIWPGGAISLEKQVPTSFKLLCLIEWDGLTLASRLFYPTDSTLWIPLSSHPSLGMIYRATVTLKHLRRGYQQGENCFLKIESWMV